VLAGSSMFRAEYFYTYVKALIFCKVPKPESGSVPGSTDYQFNSIRKFMWCVVLELWRTLCFRIELVNDK